MSRVIAVLDSRLREARRKPVGMACGKILEDVDVFIPAHIHEKRRALISYLPEHLRVALSESGPVLFNPQGIVLELTRALNELGYTVDMVDLRDENFIPLKPYEIYVGHGPEIFERIFRHLDPACRKIRFTTGSWQEVSRKESDERYARFCRSRNRPLPARYEREAPDSTFSVTHADLVTALGPLTAATFRPHAKKVAVLNNAAYPTIDINSIKRRHDIGRKNFLYFTANGNVQKGLDVLIEAFLEMPDLNLKIYCPLEADILENYKKELRASNIQYVYHHRHLRGGLMKLLNTSTYTLGVVLLSGQSTALISSLSYGLIPVALRSADFATDGVGCLIPSLSIPDVVRTIREASEKPVEWCERESQNCLSYFDQYHHPEHFRNDFKRGVEDLLQPRV